MGFWMIWMFFLRQSSLHSHHFPHHLPPVSPVLRGGSRDDRIEQTIRRNRIDCMDSCRQLVSHTEEIGQTSLQIPFFLFLLVHETGMHEAGPAAFPAFFAKPWFAR